MERKLNLFLSLALNVSMLLLSKKGIWQTVTEFDCSRKKTELVYIGSSIRDV